MQDCGDRIHRGTVEARRATPTPIARTVMLQQPGSWTVGRTKASGTLLAEEYGRILSFFDECGPEHGPRRVQEEMGVPHYEDKLPQGPVLWA